LAQRANRKIIHIDGDCFYAAVEIRDDPRLRGLPMAAGGYPDRRGVIAACSYEARPFGVWSAISSSQLSGLCEQGFRRSNWPVRLLGVEARFSDPERAQLILFDGG